MNKRLKALAIICITIISVTIILAVTLTKILGAGEIGTIDSIIGGSAFAAIVGVLRAEVKTEPTT